MGSMGKDHYYAQMLELMRSQGKKDNPTTLQIGVMLSANSVKIDDLVLNSEDLYIADYLIEGYERKIKTPYVSSVSLNVSKADYVTDVSKTTTEESSIVYSEGLKKGDLVAVQKLNDNDMYVILARVVSV